MSVIVKLSCGHSRALNTAYARYGVGDEEQCKACDNRWFMVMACWKDQWHSKCRRQGCPYGASHGMVKTYAERAAARHEARSGHVGETFVTFYNDCPASERPKVEDNKTDIPTLFDLPNAVSIADIPPF